MDDALKEVIETVQKQIKFLDGYMESLQRKPHKLPTHRSHVRDCARSRDNLKAWLKENSQPPAQPEPSPDTEQPDMRDAYAGAREDLAIWKRRALEAEAINRNLQASLTHADNRATEAEETIQRMCDQLNAENGPTFMGEPVLRDTEQQRRDAAKKAYTRMTNNMVIIDDLVAYYLHSLDMKAFDEYFDEAAIEAEGNVRG